MKLPLRSIYFSYLFVIASTCTIAFRPNEVIKLSCRCNSIRFDEGSSNRSAIEYAPSVQAPFEPNISDFRTLLPFKLSDMSFNPELFNWFPLRSNKVKVLLHINAYAIDIAPFIPI